MMTDIAAIATQLRAGFHREVLLSAGPQDGSDFDVACQVWNAAPPVALTVIGPHTTAVIGCRSCCVRRTVGARLRGREGI